MRLLILLEQEELTVAELAQLTLLAQPRVSTHLARLREAGLVRDRKSGVQSYYRSAEGQQPDGYNAIWSAIKSRIDDAMLEEDRERLPAVLSSRASSNNWADSVAGYMERHYSPGRTWEATARAMLQLLDLGDVLDLASGDGVLAELMAGRARSVTCLDFSDRVVAAGRRRLRKFGNVSFESGDMHQLRFDAESFDVALLMHALTYTEQPALVVAEIARVLRPGGVLVGATLKKHAHKSAVDPFDHVNMGFTVRELSRMCTEAGLQPETCAVTSKETRAPNFEIITLLARKP